MNELNKNMLKNKPNEEKEKEKERVETIRKEISFLFESSKNLSLNNLNDFENFINNCVEEVKESKKGEKNINNVMEKIVSKFLDECRNIDNIDNEILEEIRKDILLLLRAVSITLNHEFSQPLMIISGNTELLAMNINNKTKAKEKISTIEKNVAKMVKTIDSLKDPNNIFFQVDKKEWNSFVEIFNMRDEEGSEAINKIINTFLLVILPSYKEQIKTMESAVSDLASQEEYLSNPRIIKKINRLKQAIYKLKQLMSNISNIEDLRTIKSYAGAQSMIDINSSDTAVA